MEDKRCLGRTTRWKTKLPFGDGKHYFTLEERCKRVCVEGEELCERCAGRPDISKYQDKINHGKITEPIPEVSYIYGSPRYVEYCAKYGQPCEEAIEAAEHAHKLATEGYPEVPMAREGRQKKEGAKPRGSVRQKVGEAEAVTEVVAASAIEVSVRPQKIEVEHVKVYRRRLGDEVVMVDEVGRAWSVDEKGVIVGYRGEWKEIVSAGQASPARSSA
jgi:hypothetical protein